LGLGNDGYEPDQTGTFENVLMQVGSDTWAAIAGGSEFTSYNMATAQLIYDHTIAIKPDGTLWSCGYNNHGQLGLGDDCNECVEGNTSADRNTLTQIESDDIWSTVACGHDFSFAISLIETNNDSPSCVDKVYEVSGQGASTTIPASLGLLAGATDPEDDTLTAVLKTCVSTPCSLSHGTLTQFNSDGSFTYLPNEGVDGEVDTFQFSVSDGNSESSICVATLNIRDTFSPEDALAMVFIDDAAPVYLTIDETIYTTDLNDWNNWLETTDLSVAVCLIHPIPGPDDPNVPNMGGGTWMYFDHRDLLPPSKSNLPPVAGQAFPNFVNYTGVGRNDGRTDGVYPNIPPLGNLTLEQLKNAFLDTAGDVVPRGLAIYIDTTGSMNRDTIDPTFDEFISWYESWTLEKIGVVGCVIIHEFAGAENERWLKYALTAVKAANQGCL
jgi:hypothetical protein